MTIHDPDSGAGRLEEFAESEANKPATDDSAADATDRVAIAIYRVGVEIVASLDYIGRQLGEVSEDLNSLRTAIKD